MKHALRLLILLTVALVFAACTDTQTSELEDDHETLEHGYAETINFLSPEDALAQFKDGVAELKPEHGFHELELVLTSLGDLSGASYQVQYKDKSWSEWQAIPMTLDLDIYYNATIETEQEAVALRVKDLGEVQFARFQFMIDVELDPFARRPGRWTLPSSTREKGNAQYVSRDGTAGLGLGDCSGRLLDGTRELGDYVKRTFSGVQYYGGYNCRYIGGTSVLSVHGVGRALDIHINPDGNDANAADNDVGDPIANWLVENAQAIGVQYIVWDRKSWGAYRNLPKDRDYTGQHPHHDHIHVELNKAGANRQTPWFKGGTPTPTDQDVADYTAEVVTRSGSLNVRSGPGTHYAKIGSLAKGSRVTVTHHNGVWRVIKFGSGKGYVHSDYLKKVTTPPACNRPTLQKGSRGTHVTFAQQRLLTKGNAYSYGTPAYFIRTSGGADGNFGNGTHNAVVAFQKSINAYFGQKMLEVDGKIGPNTWYWLGCS